MPARPYVLTSSVVVRAPLDEVFPFFADAGNLESLTPDFLHFAILTPRPIAMAAGARIEYRIRVHGLPLRWRTVITAWEPPHRFVDFQEHGPYRVWNHEHTFRSVPGGTELGDRVELMPRGGPLGPLVFRLFVKRDVLTIFRFREQEIARRFGLVSATPPRIERAPEAQ